MPYPDPTVIGRQRGRHGGRSIPMHQHNIGLFLFKYRLKPLQNIAGNIKKILPRLHDIQVIVRPDFKEIQNLIQHLAMLSRHADNTFKPVRMLFKLLDNRSHLDRLGTCAEDG